MALIEQIYNLDLVPSGQPLVVNVSQYDVDSRTLTFNLFNGGVAYAPDGGTAAYIMGTKPDATGFIYAMTVSGTSASVDIYQQMTAVAGNIPCEVRLVDTSGAVIGSANFTLAVEKAALDDDTVISDSDIPLFEELAAQAAQSAADAADSADAAAALIPADGTVGQVLTKTADGTAWDDAAMATMVVTITYANSTYSADKTFAEIYAEINNGGVPIAKYGGIVLRLEYYSSTSMRFGGNMNSNGDLTYTISSSNVVTVGTIYVAPTYYYWVTLGSATATSDSTVYSGGYKLTISSNYITANSTCDVYFTNDDYFGNVTWETSAGSVVLYFDQNPNSKTIRIEWKNVTYTNGTLS